MTLPPRELYKRSLHANCLSVSAMFLKLAFIVLVPIVISDEYGSSRSSMDCTETECSYGNGCVMRDGQPTCVPVDPNNNCEKHECDTGEECMYEEVVCVKAPCYPIPTCTKEGDSERKEATKSQSPGKKVNVEPAEQSLGNMVKDENPTASVDFIPPDDMGKIYEECKALNCPSGKVCEQFQLKTTCEVDELKSCDYRCAAGELCVVQKVQCFAPPCYPIAICVSATKMNEGVPAPSKTISSPPKETKQESKSKLFFNLLRLIICI
uniref:TIL domain-containing protein n=1 Tax=Heterorhabditis bacteriophora TaxID=37862 RepID=A0A1I7X5F4_HETBA